MNSNCFEELSTPVCIDGAIPNEGESNKHGSWSYEQMGNMQDIELDFTLLFHFIFELSHSHYLSPPTLIDNISDVLWLSCEGICVCGECVWGCLDDRLVLKL